MKVLIIGDVHHEFGTLNTLINKKNPDILIQCGDFAYYWTGQTSKNLIKPHNTKIYWIPGNHEDWITIEELHGRNGKVPIEIEPNIFYCPIGSALTIDEVKILFVGGAYSIDYMSRTPGYTWFTQEVLKESDYNYIIENVHNCDMVISHTCPREFNIESLFPEKRKDPSKDYLSAILNKYKPHTWFYGHYHQFMQGNVEATGTQWYCLDAIHHRGRSFMELEF
jgi:Icc-related predicted phosphoesterase